MQNCAGRFFGSFNLQFSIVIPQYSALSGLRLVWKELNTVCVLIIDLGHFYGHYEGHGSNAVHG
jgi:hypothetical protein